MPEPPSGASRNLGLSTVAFALCFSAWGLMAPLARRFEDDLDLSSTETAVLIAIPVVLGSLLRIPVGLLTDRLGGRIMFTAILLLSAPPSVALGFAESYWALVGVGFVLGVAGSSFAVGVPFVARWYGRERQGFAVGVYGMGNIGTAVAAFSAPAVVDGLGRPALGFFAGAILVAGQRSSGCARRTRRASGPVPATGTCSGPAGGSGGSRSSTSSPSAGSLRWPSSSRSCSSTGSTSRSSTPASARPVSPSSPRSRGRSEAGSPTAGAAQTAARSPCRPTRCQVSTRPLPFTSTSPRRSQRKSPRTRSHVARVMWTRPGTPCDSIRLAMLTVSPQRS